MVILWCLVEDLEGQQTALFQCVFVVMVLTTATHYVVHQIIQQQKQQDSLCAVLRCCIQTQMVVLGIDFQDIVFRIPSSHAYAVMLSLKMTVVLVNVLNLKFNGV
jgi:hypothetical protein